ncbi:MAG: TolC family protein, partial [Myxococcales bacterium]|nr:TolC family protein [Myxococcales bacterium]
RVEAAAAAERKAGLWPNPTLELAMGTIPIGPKNPEFTGRDIGFNDIVNYSVALSQTFELGKRGPRIDAARWIRRARHSLLLRQIGERAAQARLAIVELFAARRRLAILERMLADAKRVRELERVRLQQGHLSGNDFDRLQVETISLAARRTRAAGQLQRAIAGCAALLAAPCTLADKATLPEPRPVDASALPSPDRRPDIVALEQARKAALARGKLARRTAIPDPTLTLGYTHDRYILSGSQRNSLMVGLALPLPIFDRGQHDSAKAIHQAAAIDAERARRAALARIQQHGLREQLRATLAALGRLERDALPRSRRVLKQSSQALARGQLSMTELLLVRRAHTGVLLSIVDARLAAHRLVNALRRTSGADATLADKSQSEAKR